MAKSEIRRGITRNRLSPVHVTLHSQLNTHTFQLFCLQYSNSPRQMSRNVDNANESQDGTEGKRCRREKKKTEKARKRGRLWPDWG